MQAIRGVCGLAIVLALLAADARAQQTGRALEERPQPGFLAPDFTLRTLDGRRITLSDFRGKKAVFLDFWATWCPYCRQEMPTMEVLYRRFKPQALEIVAVSSDGAADVSAFIKAHRLTFPVVLDPGDAVAEKYQVTGVPTHYFIDRRGVIRTREAGSKDWSKPETWTLIEELLR